MMRQPEQRSVDGLDPPRKGPLHRLGIVRRVLGFPLSLISFTFSDVIVLPVLGSSRSSGRYLPTIPSISAIEDFDSNMKGPARSATVPSECLSSILVTPAIGDQTWSLDAFRVFCTAGIASSNDVSPKAARVNCSPSITS